jgi:hypothetical protein
MMAWLVVLNMDGFGGLNSMKASTKEEGGLEEAEEVESKDEKKHIDNNNSTNKDIEYFAWMDKELNYITSRQIYCNFYERFICKSPCFLRIVGLLAQGYQLQLCGPDAHVIPRLHEQSMADALEVAYLNGDRPFGHERVLFTMLTCPRREQWPWVKHKTLEF